MPVMGGLEAAQAIRAREARRSWSAGSGVSSIPIIAMTAHAMQGAIASAAWMRAWTTMSPSRSDPPSCLRRSSGSAAGALPSAAAGTDSSLLESASAARIMDLAETRALLDGDEAALATGESVHRRPAAQPQRSSMKRLVIAQRRGSPRWRTFSGCRGVFHALQAQDAAQRGEMPRASDTERACRDAPLVAALNTLATACGRRSSAGAAYAALLRMWKIAECAATRKGLSPPVFARLVR